jgi:hypothetical protein
MLVVNLRTDLIFSYWIFFWFLLYLAGLTKIAPTLFIYLGLILNALELVYFMVVKAPSYNIVKFATINIILKGIPLLFVYGRPITLTEIKISILVFMIYIVWLQINHKSLTDVYEEVMRTYKGEKTGQKTAISTWYDKIFDAIF